MNKKIIVGISCFLLAGTVLATTSDFDIEGRGSSLDVIEQKNKELRDSSINAQDYFTREFAAIERERKELGVGADRGKIGAAEYKQACSILDGRQKRIDEERQLALKSGHQISDNIQTLFTSAIQAKIEQQNQEEKRKTEEARRKTLIGEKAVAKGIAEDGARERLELMLQKDNLTKVGIFASLTAAGVVGGYFGLKFLYKYMYSMLGVPTLVRESPRVGAFSSLLGWVMPEKEVKQDEAFAQIVLAPELETTITSLAHATVMTHVKGLQYRHLLLHGPPGTGKTLIAKTLARASGMDYAIISGADFSQFKAGMDVQKLHEVFDWAEKGKRGLILFIDEADALLRDRKQLSENGVKLVNAFLSRTNGSSEKFMLVLATNYPEFLDSAVLSRVNKKVEIALPGADERAKLLRLYIDKYLKNAVVGKDALMLVVEQTINDASLQNIAQKINGFSGREIDQMVAEVQIEAFTSGNNRVTKALFEAVVAGKIKQHQEERALTK